jgi:hypothetical protein
MFAIPRHMRLEAPEEEETAGGTEPDGGREPAATPAV